MLSHCRLSSLRHNGTMVTCTRCDSLIHDQHLPPPGTTYNVGDIIALLESVHVPVHDHIFNQEPVLHRRGSTTSALSKNSQFRGRLRPAIVLERRLREWQAEHGAEETVVLLFATYEGDFRVRRLLPSILQLFCVAVYPHSEIAEDPDAFHLHTSPEWSNSKKDSTDLHAWLIARQFTSRGQTSDRWKNANRTRQNPHSSSVVDQETRERLLGIIEEKWDQWEALCDEDPSYPETCRREYQEFQRKQFPRSGSPTVGFHAFTTCGACQDTKNDLSINVTCLSSPIWRAKSGSDLESAKRFPKSRARSA
ncbi:hypothetical protein C8Q74DRAFT_393715 [Fomes fomentarius]|nr:hypothetical protein C8Q74DRAFT_393715 [Fomes fomentarius]